MFSKALLVLNGTLPGRVAALTSRLLAAGTAALPAVDPSRRRGRGTSRLGAEILSASLGSECDIVVVPARTDSLVGTLTEASTAAVRAHRPVLVVPTDRLDGFASGDAPEGLLSHVVVLADYAFVATCAHACTARLVTQGARHVTLRHTHGLRPRSSGAIPGRGELQWIDFVRVELLKNQLLQAGAERVEFQLDECGGFAFPDDATIVVLSGHCRPETIEAFAARASVHAKTGAVLPAVLLPAGACCPPAYDSARH